MNHKQNMLFQLSKNSPWTQRKTFNLHKNNVSKITVYEQEMIYLKKHNSQL